MEREKHKLPAGIPADLSGLGTLLQRDGPLDRAWEGFEPREAQQVMFLKVLEAFRTGGTAVIEAGTGTGKTLAYLLPALISGKRTFVSTGLKNLQEQIRDKDLRFIREHFDRDFTAVVVKGRQNYLCLRLLQSIDMRIQKSFSARERDTYSLITRWAGETESGELEELDAFDFIFSKDPPFDRLHSTSEGCLGQACSCNERCFVTKIRRKAAESDIVLVNHHLFMADLAIRRRGAGFLPDWEAVVFDEAHLILDVAADYFSYKSSTKDLLNAEKYLEQVIGWEQGKAPGKGTADSLEELRRLAEGVEGDVLRLSNRFSSADGEEFLWPRNGVWQKKDVELRNLLNGLVESLDHILSKLEIFKDESDDFKAAVMDLTPHFEALDFIAQNADDTYVYQVKSDSSDVEFSAVPIDVSPWLSKYLFNKRLTTVLCSATLSTGGSLDYFKKKTGVAEPAEGLILSSPFDYGSNTILYVPHAMPMPPRAGRSVEGYDEAVADQIRALLEISEGRALVLFTSFRQMNLVRDALQGRPGGWNLLWQEAGKSRSQLLDDFRRDYHSVLLATHSFWQGVDIPGQSLSSVIIDKIPFPRPNSPIMQARKEYIEKNGGSAFNDYSIPEAILSLKQGLGRLIRSKSDWGLLAILDSRIHLLHYGSDLLKSLGIRANMTTRLSDVRQFFNLRDTLLC